MIIGARRAALIAAIAAVVIVIILYPILVETPIEVDKIDIQLTQVTLESGSVEDQNLQLDVVFALNNINDRVLTTSKLDYELFADGFSLGRHTLSYEDIPLNGRPALFFDTPVSLTDEFALRYSDANADVFNKILDGSAQIKWRVEGTAQIESGTTFVPKDFADEI